jgi:hypothetical protein
MSPVVTFNVSHQGSLRRALTQKTMQLLEVPDEGCLLRNIRLLRDLPTQPVFNYRSLN